MKIKWKTLSVCVAVPLIIGGIAGIISSSSMNIFEALTKPALAPPGWVFPVAWAILYFLMGIAAYLVLTANAPRASYVRSIKIYGVSLFFNFLWPILFFNLGLYYIAFAWLFTLWALVLSIIILFSRISKAAAYLMHPYFLWVGYAGYLNLGIAILN